MRREDRFFFALICVILLSWFAVIYYGASQQAANVESTQRTEQSLLAEKRELIDRLNMIESQLEMYDREVELTE